METYYVICDKKEVHLMEYTRKGSDHRKCNEHENVWFTICEGD